MLLERLDLEEGEDILKLVRKHWFILVSELAGVVVTACLPFILLAIAANTSQAFSLTTLNLASYSAEITFMLTLWLLFSILSGFVIWTHYYLDLWIITDRRIIAVQQTHFFDRNVAIFRLERLQDIEFKISGLIATFFNFGTLSAQTAGHHEANFKSTGMPNPDELQATIQKAMDVRLAELGKRTTPTVAEIAGE